MHRKSHVNKRREIFQKRSNKIRINAKKRTKSLTVAAPPLDFSARFVTGYWRRKWHRFEHLALCLADDTMWWKTSVRFPNASFSLCYRKYQRDFSFFFLCGNLSIKIFFPKIIYPIHRRSRNPDYVGRPLSSEIHPWFIPILDSNLYIPLEWAIYPLNGLKQIMKIDLSW